jgi:hypothetical protein
VALAVDQPLTAVGPKYHRLIVGGFGDDCDRPSDFSVVVAHVRQELYDGPRADRRGRNGLDTGAMLGQPRLIVLDELSELPMTADLLDPWLGPPVAAPHVSGGSRNYDMDGVVSRAA